MEAEIRYETKRLDHLGIVAGICDEIGLVEVINEVIGTNGRKVSNGHAVKAMVLNGLGFTGKAMYLVPEYLRNKPVDILIGAEYEADDFNDDSLGRCLDDLHAKGITSVFLRLGQRALAVYEIELKFVHLDSTSFHCHGEYSAGEEDQQVITISHGYSKEHRPDLKQAILNLITSQKEALPVWLEALSGNTSDKKSFPETVKSYLGQFKEDEPLPMVVMDSAGYSEEMLMGMGEMLWLTRVPETLSTAQELVTKYPKDELAQIKAGYWGQEEKCEYAGVKQRWLLVFSEAAYERECQTLEKKQAKEMKKASTAWRKVCRQTFSCQEDAEKARKAFEKLWKFHRTQAVTTPRYQYRQPGRPPADALPDLIGYQLAGSVIPANQLITAAKARLGKFIIATNQMDTDQLSAHDMLENYTAQGTSVERGFRFLKDPLFFAHSLFLKNPARIMALLMIMGLSLLIYALAERKLRQNLAATGLNIPNQKRQPIQNPTMRWIFQLFDGIDLLTISQNQLVISRQVLNLRPEHLTVIGLLGPPVQNCYILDP